MTETVSLSQFARQQGWNAAHVTRLKQAGRLVLTEDGRVNVEASIARIKDTEDPNRDDVRERWREQRSAGATPVDTQTTSTFQQARAVKERYHALTAKLEYERLSGNLVETAAVHAAGAEAGTVIRAVLENLADQLAPMLAPITDEDQLRNVLADQFDSVLAEIADRLSAIAQRVAQTAEHAKAGQ